MKKTTKALALVLCAMLLVVGSVMGTLAYLTSEAEVTNTFTAGNVRITLQEREMDVATGKVKTDGALVEKIEGIKILPGREVEKQPVITVGDTSENCWLFVKVENGDVAKDILAKGTFTPSDGWSSVTDRGGWYQYDKQAKASDQVQVFTKFTYGNLTNEDVTTLTDGSIKITAYAVQCEGVGINEALEVAIGLSENAN